MNYISKTEGKDVFCMDYFQLIPLLSLTGYFFYLTYYYAVPMFCLKILLFAAHLRYHCSDIRFADGRITVKYTENWEEHVLVRMIEVDPTSRFLAMTTCSTFRGMLRDIRQGVQIEKGDAQYGLSAGERSSGTGRQRIEEDCD